MQGTSSWKRRIGAVTALGTAAALLVWAAAGTASAHRARYAVLPGTMLISADAYGSRAAVAGTVKSGATAPVGIGGCTMNGKDLPIHSTNSAGSVAIPQLGAGTAAVDDAADAVDDGTALTSTGTSVVDGVSLLGGLIKAAEIKSVSSTSFSGGSFTMSAAGSRLGRLKVAGVSIGGDAAPNTTIALPGVGDVVVNEQVEGHSSLTVNMLHVHVTQSNALGYPIGSDLIVGHASSELKEHGPVVATIGGGAFGARVSGSLVSPAAVKLGTGPVAPVGLSCFAPKHAQTNFSGGLKVPSDGSVLVLGAINTSADGDTSSTSASAETTATVANSNLLQGLVKAKGISAHVGGVGNGGAPSFTDSSTFGTLSVAGHPELGADVGPNTSVEVAGVGTLWLHRVIHHSDSLTVRMIELKVTVAGNPLGLAVGADVQVGVAGVSIHNV